MSKSLTNGLIGKPFKSGGRGPNNYDCFGLVMEVFKRLGQVIPDYGKGIAANDWETISNAIDGAQKDWTEIPNPVRGCLLVVEFPYPGWKSHVGIMLDGDRFLNIRIKTEVCIDRISSPAWRKREKEFYIYNGKNSCSD